MFAESRECCVILINEDGSEVCTSYDLFRVDANERVNAHVMSYLADELNFRVEFVKR